MAFPTANNILDNFNRTNEGPPPSASWTTYGYGLQVYSNTLVGGSNASNICSGIYTGGSYGNDQECFLTINTLTQTNVDFGIYLRFSDTGSDGYIITYVRNSGVLVGAWIADAWTQIGSTISQAFSAGDAIGAEIIGQTLKVYRKPSGGAWAQIGGNFTMSTRTAGRLGAFMYGTTGRGDDFGGGTVVVSGTVIPVFMHQYRQRRR